VKDGGIHIDMGKPFSGSNETLPVEIRIEFTKHIPVPPILTPLAPDIVFVAAQRGKFHDWIFKIQYEMAGDPPPNVKRSLSA
jgi:hypothetical protein